MKKYIIMLVFILAGCGYAVVDGFNKYVIITEIRRNADYCYYYGKGNPGAVFTLTEDDFKFIDTCGKFQIGDTVRFVK